MDATANASNGKKLNGSQKNAAPLAEKKDYSLKEGETINITIGVSSGSSAFRRKIY
jgi:hypothetical protein